MANQVDEFPRELFPAIELCADVLSTLVYKSATEPSWWGVTVKPLLNDAIGSIVLRNGVEVCMVRVRQNNFGEILVTGKGGQCIFRDRWGAMDHISGILGLDKPSGTVVVF